MARASGSLQIDLEQVVSGAGHAQGGVGLLGPPVVALHVQPHRPHAARRSLQRPHRASLQQDGAALDCHPCDGRDRQGWLGRMVDEAVDLKLEAETPRDLDKIADLCEEAIEKGIKELSRQ